MDMVLKLLAQQGCDISRMLEVERAIQGMIQPNDGLDYLREEYEPQPEGDDDDWPSYESDLYVKSEAEIEAERENERKYGRSENAAPPTTPRTGGETPQVVDKGAANEHVIEATKDEPSNDVAKTHSTPDGAEVNSDKASSNTEQGEASPAHPQRASAREIVVNDIQVERPKQSKTTWVYPTRYKIRDFATGRYNYAFCEELWGRTKQYAAAAMEDGTYGIVPEETLAKEGWGLDKEPIDPKEKDFWEITPLNHFDSSTSSYPSVCASKTPPVYTHPEFQWMYSNFQELWHCASMRGVNAKRPEMTQYHSVNDVTRNPGNAKRKGTAKAVKTRVCVLCNSVSLGQTHGRIMVDTGFDLIDVEFNHVDRGTEYCLEWGYHDRKWDLAIQSELHTRGFYFRKTQPLKVSSLRGGLYYYQAHPPTVKPVADVYWAVHVPVRSDDGGEGALGYHVVGRWLTLAVGEDTGPLSSCSASIYDYKLIDGRLYSRANHTHTFRITKDDKEPEAGFCMKVMKQCAIEQPRIGVSGYHIVPSRDPEHGRIVVVHSDHHDEDMTFSESFLHHSALRDSWIEFEESAKVPKVAKDNDLEI